MQPGNIDMLLGAEQYAEIIEEGLIRGPEGYPVAQQTLLGWIVSGRVPHDYKTTYQTPKVSLLCSTTEIQTVEHILKQFWEIEELPNCKMTNPEEELCEEIFAKNHYRRDDGRYVVPLTFKNNTPPKLGNSRDIAKKRLVQMEGKFSRNPKLFEEYKKFIEEYLSLGHMEKIKYCDDIDKTSEGDEYYLPHHAVFKESSTTTKLRVVFDASCKPQNSQSLNDCLLTGQPLQKDLCTILMRWRKYRVAVTADIEKMYRQIYIDPNHCKYQKILWRDSPTKPIEEYRLSTVTYGTSCAPYLAIRTLMQLAYDEKSRFPLASDKILSDFYVDDLMTGTDTIEEAIFLQSQLRRLLNRGGFNLRKWVCNIEQVLDHIPEQDREINRPFHIDFNETVKALGIHWNPKADKFEFKVSLQPTTGIFTKRTLLSEIARLFDPLGWLTPTVIIAKIMLQKLWIEKIEWNDELPCKLRKQWMEYRSELPKLERIKIVRWLNYINNNTSLELHAFCDASNFAYAAVVYARCITLTGEVVSTLLAAKSKVAPIRQVSIPRLELCGAHLLSKLIIHVKDALQIENVKVYGWTDSLNVLAWLRGHPRQWQTFIANRVSQIQENLTGSQWRYVRSHDNPADCASRGVMPEELINHPLWWTGPPWLKEPEFKWPKNISSQFETELEVRKTALLSSKDENLDLEIICRFSNLRRLIRSIAYCRRFYLNLKVAKEYRNTDALTVSEINKARQCIEKFTQKVAFHNEIQILQNKQMLSPTNKLYNFSPWMDQDGLIRIGGRLQNANIPPAQKHPILLPGKDHFTKLVIRDCHERTLHGGSQITLNLIRKRYWIINARNVVRHQIHKCITCYRYKNVVQTQLMGDLPSARVQPNRPFLHTGVDFTGYILLKESKCRGRPKTSKGYVSVFVCLCTKAIHLELVSELTTNAFLAAFRRFVSRRGLCSDIYSDCGTNFVGANQALIQAKLAAEYGLDSTIKNSLALTGTQWHFIPPAAPHFGGLWEAGVKSVKHHLKRVLGNALLTYEELSTVLTQIEACLNSRPLSPLNNDPNDLIALTPGHFLVGDALLTPPERNVLDLKINSLNRWQLLQRMLQDFWKRWSNEYLPRLQQRSKWAQSAPNIKEGHLVLLRDERLPPARWLLGRVLEVHPGKDNRVRVVTIKTKDAILKRPIVKLCPLPISDNQNK